MNRLERAQKAIYPLPYHVETSSVPGNAVTTLTIKNPFWGLAWMRKEIQRLANGRDPRTKCYTNYL